jgi:hypothetical protein
MAIENKVNNLNGNISDDVQTKLHWLLCNTNITKETQVKLIGIINETFVEGTKYRRNEAVDSVTEK